MASYKNVQKSRRKKESHFSYTSEQMTSLTSPPAAGHGRHDGHSGAHADRDHDVRSVLSVRPGQAPVTRRVPGADHSHGHGQDSEVSVASSDSVNIPPESLHKLQEIIEAQKAFLKFQEIRAISLFVLAENPFSLSMSK